MDYLDNNSYDGFGGSGRGGRDLSRPYRADGGMARMDGGVAGADGGSKEFGGLSVVVPVWNRCGLVGRALGSIGSQSVRPDHIVVVDNGSTDGSLEAVLRWAAEYTGDARRTLGPSVPTAISSSEDAEKRTLGPSVPTAISSSEDAEERTLGPSVPTAISSSEDAEERTLGPDADGVWRFVAADGRRVSVAVEPRRGACAARNRGLALVDTEWMMHFDSDDEMLPGHLERAVAAMKRGDADVVGWDTELRREDGSSKLLRFYSRNMEKRNVLNGMMSTQRWAARTALVRRAGGWNEELKIWDDIELGARMLALHPRVRRVKGAPTVAVWASGDASITGSGFASRAGRYEAALQAIERTLGARGAAVIAVKRGVLAADIRREGGRMERPCGWRGTAAYWWRRVGLPGAGWLFGACS